jgi:hypothetical protein
MSPERFPEVEELYHAARVWCQGGPAGVANRSVEIPSPGDMSLLLP